VRKQCKNIVGNQRFKSRPGARQVLDFKGFFPEIVVDIGDGLGYYVSKMKEQKTSQDVLQVCHTIQKNAPVDELVLDF